MSVDLFDPSAVTRALYDSSRQALVAAQSEIDYRQASVVLFLLGNCPAESGDRPEPCLILNKRSARVRQAGDLCCPGGGITPGLDRPAAGLLKYPGDRWIFDFETSIWPQSTSSWATTTPTGGSARSTR